ncbi:MAG: alpha/beta hydrolase, partial [Pseudomonadota bacterium]
MAPQALRRGPRPLAFHLGLSTLRAAAAALSLPAGESAKQNCWTGSPPWNSAWPLSKPGQQEASRIAHALAASGETAEALAGAVRARLVTEHAALLAGLNTYRAAEIEPAAAPTPCLWRHGSSAVHDYGGDGPVVLFVPSLINRSHILDLCDGHSMLRHLAGRGMRPLLLDWGAPGEDEAGFTLTDYILRLEAA